MKRIIIFLLTACLLFTAGCAAHNEETVPSESAVPETTVPVTEAPETLPPETEPPLPEMADAEIMVDGTPAVLMLLARGDEVDVVGEYDEAHFVIKTEQGYGLVEKQLLRFEGEAAYEVWTGYAKYGAKLMGSYQLAGEPVKELGMNTQIEILDELEYCYVAAVDGENGFIRKDEVSRHYIQYSGGGSSGGQDGGDITMGYTGGVELLSAIEQTGEVTGKATVLADGTQVVLGYYQRGDVAQIVMEEGFAPAMEGWHTVYLDGIYAYVPQNLVLAPGAEPYAQWEGYAGYHCDLYDNYLLLGEKVRPVSVNTSVTILWEGGEFYLISINDEMGYVAKTEVGINRFATGGGGGGGGEWTPPVL